MIRYLIRLLRRARDIGADEYEQLSILQRTNMSEVWLARRKADRLITVTKIARVDNTKFAKANQKAILNEAQWLHSLQGDPRIIQIYRTGETTLPGKPRFIAAEYLAGGTVEDLLEQESIIGRVNRLLLLLFTLGRRPYDKDDRPNLFRFFGLPAHRLTKGPLPVEQALLITKYIAEALDHMHSKGVVHRDIKPDNVMFRYRPRHGQAIADDNLVLIDFGIASAHNRTTGAAIARGWSEPQRIQARNERKPILVYSGFDTYCLGKVLRYLLTNLKPLNVPEPKLKEPLDHSQLRIRKSVSLDDRIELTQSLSTLIQDCLHRDVEMRPSAKEVIVAAEQMLGTLSNSRRLLSGSRSGSYNGSSRGLSSGSISEADQSAIPVQEVEESLGAVGKRRQIPSYRYAGALITIALGLILSSWIGQYDANALTELASPITELFQPAATAPSVDSESVPSLEPNQPVAAAEPTASHASEDEEPALSETAMDDEDTAPDAAAVAAASATIPETAEPTSTALPTALSTSQPSESNQKSGQPNDQQPMPAETPTSTVEPSPTRKNRPTNTPTAPSNSQADAQAVQQPQTEGSLQPQTSVNQQDVRSSILTGVVADVDPNTNGCRSDSPDTWDERVEIKWTLNPPGTTLPPGYAQEVVVWRPGADPFDLNQAYTIHGRDEILASEGSFILQRKPKSLIPTVIERNEELIWGILLVDSNSGARYQRLTPGDCRFHPAGRLFGDGPTENAGGER